MIYKWDPQVGEIWEVKTTRANNISSSWCKLVIKEVLPKDELYVISLNGVVSFVKAYWVIDNYIKVA